MCSEAQLDVLQLERRLEELRAIWHKVKECDFHPVSTQRRSSLLSGPTKSLQKSRSQSQQLREKPSVFPPDRFLSPSARRRHTLESAGADTPERKHRSASLVTSNEGQATSPSFSPTHSPTKSIVAIQRQDDGSIASRSCTIGKLPLLENSFSQQSPRACQACGFAKIRPTAQFCQQCGKHV